MTPVRSLAGKIVAYDAPSTEEIARRTGIPVADILRFDGNTSPHLLPSTRAEALADELVLLVVRSFAGRGDRVAIANDPTYPIFSIAAWVAGAELGDDEPALTIC